VHYQEVRNKWFGIDITHDDGRREHMDVQERRPIK
jgi:outer membrane protein